MTGAVPAATRAGSTRCSTIAILAGDLDAVRRLLDAGARVDGAPAADHDAARPGGVARPRSLVRELVGRGARLRWPDGGSAVGAALHGSRHCHDPEGGPTMRTVEETPRERYARDRGGS